MTEEEGKERKAREEGKRGRQERKAEKNDLSNSLNVNWI